MNLFRGARSGKEDPDDILLARYLKTGDLNILGELYRRYIPLVYGVCLKYLPGREDARDAVMDIFEKIIIELGRHRVDRFRPWLYVLTKNWCLMYLRSSRNEDDQLKKMAKEQSLIMEIDMEVHPIDRDNGISGKLLDDCIERLKKEQKMCIQLFYYDNRSYREVATILNLDEKMVKSHLQNAKRNLKICIEENYVTEE